MRVPPDAFRRVVITGLDGSGKSTVARESALQLSDAYRDADIRVADSGGVVHFRGGEPTRHIAPWLIDLEPTAGQSKLRSLGKLGVFTAMRQLTEAISYREDSLVIGVRDPYRIDPATYASIYGPSKLQAMTHINKLKLFHRMAIAPHPAAIMYLEGDTDAAAANAAERGTLSPHETPEAMAKLALELTGVLGAYETLFERPVHTVAALTPHTTDDVTAYIEAHLPPTKRIYAVPAEAPKPLLY